MPPSVPAGPGDGVAPAGRAAGIATVKGAALFPASAVPRPTLAHARAMLVHEQTEVLRLLEALDASAWQSDTLRGRVADMVAEAEEVGRNRRFTGRLRRARLLPGAMTAARRRRRSAVLAAAPPQQLIAELAVWGHKAADAVPWYRRTPASRLLAAAPAGRDLDYLFRVLLPRSAWLSRAGIAQAAGCAPVLGPHAAEVIRQVVRDLGDCWGGPAVAIEVTGPAGGRWLAGDGEPVAVLRAGPLALARHLTGPPPDETVAASGDAPVAAALLGMRIPG